MNYDEFDLYITVYPWVRPSNFQNMNVVQFYNYLVSKSGSERWIFLKICEVYLDIEKIFYSYFVQYFLILSSGMVREFPFQMIWSTWNWTLHKFLRKNMQAGISNMEDIHELNIWNDTYAFRVHMTTVLIEKTPLLGCVQRLEVHAFWQKLCEKVTKSHLKFR